MTPFDAFTSGATTRDEPFRKSFPLLSESLIFSPSTVVTAPFFFATATGRMGAPPCLQPAGESSTDAHLVRRVDAGDTDALRLLHERYARLVYRTAYRVLGDRETAEECTQDAFVTAWRSAGRYSPERASVPTWLIAVARNRAIDAARRRSARPVEPREDVVALDEAPDPAAVVLDADEAGRIRAALAALPDPQREAISLAYYAGLSHSEIAERMGVPVGTVKGRIRLALDRLRAIAPICAFDAASE